MRPWIRCGTGTFARSSGSAIARVPNIGDVLGNIAIFARGRENALGVVVANRLPKSVAYFRKVGSRQILPLSPQPCPLRKSRRQWGEGAETRHCLLS